MSQGFLLSEDMAPADRHDLTYGYAVTQHRWWVAAMGSVAVIIFSVLDASFSQARRAFRKLYDKVSTGGEIQPSP